MSIDKFGRSTRASKRPAVGPKGEGYNLTPDGDYDLQNKRICNVGVPKADSDGVTKVYVDAKVIPRYEDCFDVQGERLSNVALPKENSDAVTKEYLELKTPIKLEKSYSVHQFRLQDVEFPENDGDAVNLIYLRSKTLCKSDGGIVNADNQVIRNVASPVQSNDAATKEYVEVYCRPITSDITRNTTAITGLKARVTECEGKIAENKRFFEKRLDKFGTYLFNYINTRATGRSTIAPLMDDGHNYLRWEELYKLPDTGRHS